MRDDRRLERLYEGLSPKETATLVFSHLSRRNVAEADRIRELVPLKVCRMPDPDHIDHFDRLRRTTLYYGMERWRYQAHCLAITAVIVQACHSDSEEDVDRGQVCLEAWQVWETRLLSLDAALEAVCTKHGVDIADVRRMTGVDSPYQVLGLGEVDPQLVAEMIETFNGVLEPSNSCERHGIG